MLRSRRARNVSVLLGLIAVAAGVIATPHFFIAFHRLRLERDLEYIFEIADSSPGSFEGRAIRAFLEDPDKRAIYAERVVAECLDRVTQMFNVEMGSSTASRVDLSTFESLGIAQAEILVAGSTIQLFIRHMEGRWKRGSGVEDDEVTALLRWVTNADGVPMRLGMTDFRVDLSRGDEEAVRRFEGEPFMALDRMRGEFEGFATATLISLRPDPTQQVAKLLQWIETETDPRELNRAVAWLAALEDRPPETVTALFRALGRTDARQEMKLLSHWDEREFWPALMAHRERLRHEPQADELGRALIMLITIRASCTDDPRGGSVLGSLLDLGDDVAVEAAREIASMGSRLAIDHLLSSLDRGVQVRGSVLDALYRVARPGDFRIASRAQHVLALDPDPSCRERAALILARTGDAALGALPELVAALDDSSSGVRKYAARAILAIAPDSFAALHVRRSDEGAR